MTQEDKMAARVIGYGTLLLVAMAPVAFPAVVGVLIGIGIISMIDGVETTKRKFKAAFNMVKSDLCSAFGFLKSKVAPAPVAVPAVATTTTLPEKATGAFTAAAQPEVAAAPAVTAPAQNNALKA